MDQKALESSLVCVRISLRSGSRFPFVKIDFFVKVEMLRFHKLENFLSLFTSVYLCVILL